MPEEGLLVAGKGPQTVAKRVIVSDTPNSFRPAFGEIGQRIISILAVRPMYPAELARELGTYHQTVYSHMKGLEKSGLVKKVRREEVRGGKANVYALSADGYAIGFDVRGEPAPSHPGLSRSRAFNAFFQEFIQQGSFDGWVVVGSPVPHGPHMTQGRDGHYAIQLGFALGQFVKVPEPFPVKLDVDVKAESLERSNLVVVGGPRTNIIAAQLNTELALRFQEGGFWGSLVDEGGRTYTSEFDCMIAKVRNPWQKSRTCILAAGVTGAGTKAAILGLTNFSSEVLRGYRGGSFAAIMRGKDLDGDGKVDSVEVLSLKSD